MNMGRIAIILMILFSIVGVQNAMATSLEDYGGIEGDMEHPPEGTKINEKLSQYYDMPIATGKDGKFWWINGYWFDTNQIKDISCEMFTDVNSPFFMNNNGNHFGFCKHVKMPINMLVLAGFLGFVFIVNLKRVKMKLN